MKSGAAGDGYCWGQPYGVRYGERGHLGSDSPVSETLPPPLKVLLGLGQVIKDPPMKERGLAIFLDYLHVGPVFCRL